MLLNLKIGEINPIDQSPSDERNFAYNNKTLVELGLNLVDYFYYGVWSSKITRSLNLTAREVYESKHINQKHRVIFNN